MKKIITFALSLLCISCISEYEAIEKLQTTPSAEYGGWISTKSGSGQLDSLHCIYIRQSNPIIRFLDFIIKTDEGYTLAINAEQMDSLHIDAGLLQRCQTLIDKLNGNE